MGSWSRRRFLGALLVSAAAPEVLAACQGSPAPAPAASPTPRRGGRIVEGVLSDPVTANPLLASDLPSRELAAALYEPLYSTYPDGRPLSRLAAGPPQVSADNLTYRVALRPDATWSDGSPITAADVTFTFDLLTSQAYRDFPATDRADALRLLDSVSAPDQRTLEFRLHAPSAPFTVEHLTHGILPRAAWAQVAAKDLATAPQNLRPALVSGAWKPSAVVPGAVTLVPNDRHWGPPPYLDQYVLKTVKDQAALADGLTSGALDFARLDPAQVADLQSKPSQSLVTFPVNSFTFFGYQLDPARPAGRLFADVRVRQALLQSLDRKQLLDLHFLKQGVVPQSCLPPYSWAYDASAGPAYDFSLEKAGALLDAAGWRRGADGIRTGPAGDRLAFTLVTNSGSSQREGLVQSMARMWKAVGAEVSPQLITFTDLLAQITTQRSFDVFLTGFNWGADPDQSALWHSRNRAPGGFNGMGYSNPAVDRALDAALATTDEARRAPLYAQMAQALNQDLPAPLIAYAGAVYAFNRRVRGHLGGDDGLGTFTQVAKPWLARTWIQTPG